ncbi:MAG: carboxypeptidase regulatory-like domain-containing protein [Myxococcaceae bacterium]|nr:carboxypeptidase regulatory-like domain-containing protein [Myxococcaceae bacterium]
MSNRSRFPLVIALLLGVVAALLLWWRLEEKPPLEGLTGATAASPPSRASAGRSPSSPQAPSATPSLEAPAAPMDGAFRIRILAAGRPIAGARVQAYLRGPEDGTGQTAWRRAGEGTTREDGEVRLATAPGLYLLSASAEGYGPARREVARPSGEAETRVELSLPAGVELRGRVVAAGRGEPVPLAEVSLRPYTQVVQARAEAVALPEETAGVTSDPQGRFAFAGLAPGRYALGVEAPGFSRRTLRVVTVPLAGELVVELWASSVLEGFVVGEEGQPVPGAEVLALGAPLVPHTSTGPGGGFSLGVSNGTYVLAARQGERMGRIPHLLTVAPGETLRDLRITLGPPSGLMGTVSAAPEGTPVPGARLVASPAGNAGEVGMATTGADGRYTLDLPPGDHDVVVSAPGRTGAVRHATAVVPGQRATLDFQLDGTAAVEGLVADVEGRPISGAHVSARALIWPHGPERFTRTDSRGAYRLEGLEVGRTVVSARREETEHWARKATELKPGDTAQVDFALAETGIVQGQVRQESGAPIPLPAVVRAMVRKGSLGEFTHVDTDAEGRYQLELPAGVYQLIAVLPGARYVYFQEDDLAVTVPAGAAVVQDLTLFDDRGVRGTVLEPSGAPSPYATVMGIQGGGDFPMAVPAQADEEGRFILPPRPRGSPPLELVAHNGGRVAELSGASEGTEHTLRLRPAATLRGRVVARHGVAPTGFSLQLLQEDGSVLPWLARGGSERHFTGDTFALYDAPALPLRVSVRTTDGRTGEATVTLSPGQSAELEVPLTGGAASIAGRAVWSGGAPAEGVAIFLDKQLTAGSDARTGPDGRFLLKEVKPGAHTVRLWAQEGKPETRRVTVASGEAVDLGDVTVSTRKASPGTVGAGFSEDRGWVSVAWLTPEGPAARAGVRVGDRLLSVDGRVVRSRQEAEQRTQGAPGTPVQLGLRRVDGQEQQLQLTRAD